MSGSQATIEPLPSPPHPSAPAFLESVTFEVGFWRRNAQVEEPFSADEMASAFVKGYNGVLVTEGQPLVFDFHGHNLKATVKSLSLLELAEKQGGIPGMHAKNMGILMEKTDVTFMKAADSHIKIRSSAKK